MTVIVAGGCRRNELALLLSSSGGKCDQHTESGKCGDLHVSPPRRVSDRRIALSHIRYVALALFWELCWHAIVYGSGFSVRTESATYIVAAVIPPIIAPSGSRGVSDYCPCHGANHATRNRGPCRTARQPVPPPITAPPRTRSCLPFAHPASVNAIAITTNVLRMT